MENNRNRRLFDTDEYLKNRKKVVNIKEPVQFKSLIYTALVGLVYVMIAYILLELIYRENIREVLYYILIIIPVVSTFLLARNLKHSLAMFIGIYAGGLLYNIILIIVAILTDDSL